MSAFTVDVIDTSCQQADQSFFPPKVTMTTKSTTQIATVLGYPEYIPSTPPKKYHKLTWDGTSEQVTVAAADGSKVSDAKYVYSGTGEIDSKGNQISDYRKDFFTPCPSSNFLPTVNSIPNFGLNILKGYCRPTDPKSCPVCQYPPVFKQNEAANLIYDTPQQMLGAEVFSTTPTTLTCGQGAGVLISVDDGPGGVIGVPQSTFNGFTGAWLLMTSANNYSATLSDEYTDSEALANAQVIISNGKTAENFIRTTGFVSRFTSVVYTLSLSNLIVGINYVVTVLFVDQSFVKSIRTYNVTATSTTATVIDVIPQPLPGNTTTLVSATVAFA